MMLWRKLQRNSHTGSVYFMFPKQLVKLMGINRYSQFYLERRDNRLLVVLVDKLHGITYNEHHDSFYFTIPKQIYDSISEKGKELKIDYRFEHGNKIVVTPTKIPPKNRHKKYPIWQEVVT